MADLKEPPSVDALIAALRKEEEYAIERVRTVTEQKIEELRVAHDALRDMPKDVPALMSQAAAVFVAEADFRLGQVSVNGALLGEIKCWPGEKPPRDKWDSGPTHRVRIIVAIMDKGVSE